MNHRLPAVLWSICQSQAMCWQPGTNRGVNSLSGLAGYPWGEIISVCVICMKYSILILIIIINSLGQILLSYIANTSRTHARITVQVVVVWWVDQINTRAGITVSASFWVFFACKKIDRPNWNANSWEEVLSVDTNSLIHLPRRSSKNCNLQFANCDRQI